MKIIKQIMPQSRFAIKCPYFMKPEGVTVHNTYNDASARNEISYMTRNPYHISFHWAVDDKEAIQAIPHNKNSWSCGDGVNGFGNRRTINIEICYSKSGGEKFIRAEKNGAKLTALICYSFGWGLDMLYTHQMHSGKYCPHRTLDLGYNRFVKMVDDELQALKGKKVVDKTPSYKTVKPRLKSNEIVAREVLNGLWGNGEDRKNRLKNQGYDYSVIQGMVNDLVNGKPTPAPKKSTSQVAREVINGKWGNGSDRKNRLEKAGYNYSLVQQEVNRLVGVRTVKKSYSEIAREVLQGKWGNGQDRKNRLTKAGYNYNEVQRIVNRLA